VQLRSNAALLTGSQFASAGVSHLFPGSRSKCCLCTKFSRWTACFTCSRSDFTFETSPSRSLPSVVIRIALQRIHSNVITEILTIRSKAPIQILSSSDNKIPFVTLYLIHFIKLCPFSNVPVPEGRTSSAREPAKAGKIFVAPRKCCLSLLIPPNCLFSDSSSGL
jgi:hypothetical protein